MKTKLSNLIFIIIILASIVVGVWAYSRLPSVIATHWNAAGQVDGYMSKFWGIFLTPIIMIFMFILYLVIPKIDPLKTNIASFGKYYNLFWILFEVFLLYIYVLQLGWNFGWQFNFSVMIIPAFAFLWYFLGAFLPKAKRNWFFGIRNPWTLSSDVVWEKTHRLAGAFFKAAALISLIGFFFPSSSIFFVIIPVLAFAIATFIYSYVQFKKLK
ncbi:MAG: DUF1648 domain-containing protein [Patescibacteria group bacterium]|nr:DUF1648 domain-containing protein [Patescibacteria group bacterium]MDD5121555.1 DUF1648 domain-containing protein [Patescibacteria group bacterium]MDD5222057.1 DUF1648 domain-containing protein [Patescibacteria group bacterium]MDD5396281.1 DUF1648 domain-containing protein [Patescibacteria group bacterium]